MTTTHCKHGIAAGRHCDACWHLGIDNGQPALDALDAARYRWLKAHAPLQQLCGFAWAASVEAREFTDVDQCIDTARKGA